MRYPDLVPDWVCNTPISLAIEAEEIDEDGAPSFTELEDLLCNYQDGGKALFQAEQKVVDVSGRAYFNGDICPNIPNITSGSAVIFGETREILQGFKRRNPDGTVNHTEVQFK